MAIDTAPSLEKPPMPAPEKRLGFVPQPKLTFEKAPPTDPRNVKKMETLNSDDKFAQQFSLRLGEQENSLSFTLGSDKERIINLDHVPVGEEAEDVWTLQRQEDGSLSVRLGENSYHYSQDQLRDQTLVLPFKDGKVTLGVARYDPDGRTIDVYKFIEKPIMPPVVSKKKGFSWPKKLVTVVTAGGIATGAVSEQPPEVVPPSYEPVPIVETVEGMPSQQIQLEEKTIDESLSCPATEPYTINPGDSLTRALIVVNGLERYLTEQGRLNVDQLYKDLACLVIRPENIAELKKSDPEVAEAIEGLTTPDSISLTGPLTNEMVHETLQKINERERFPGAHQQLVVIQPNQGFAIPKFGPKP